MSSRLVVCKEETLCIPYEKTELFIAFEEQMSYVDGGHCVIQNTAVVSVPFLS